MKVADELTSHWISAALLASVPWIVLWQLPLVPATVAVALVLRPPWRRPGPADPWASGIVVLSCLIRLAWSAGWPVTGAWALIAGLVAVVAWASGARPVRRPDTADAVALLGWGGAFVVHPALLSSAGGGWLVPALLLIAALSVRRRRKVPAVVEGLAPGPPEDEIRGELVMAHAVLAGDDGTPCSAPISLHLMPGESLAVVCDSAAEAQALALTLAGRRAPLAGTVELDGRPLAAGVVTVAAPGELFVAGDLESNLEALSDECLSDGVRTAVHEACALDEVEAALGEREVAPDGSPLSVFHRLLVLAARVIPSHYRVLVVVDPMPWVNAVRGELWRAAVVRASVGRTTVWITPDRELASRADTILESRHGALLPVR